MQAMTWTCTRVNKSILVPIAVAADVHYCTSCWSRIAGVEWVSVPAHRVALRLFGRGPSFSLIRALLLLALQVLLGSQTQHAKFTQNATKFTKQVDVPTRATNPSSAIIETPSKTQEFQTCQRCTYTCYHPSVQLIWAVCYLTFIHPELVSKHWPTAPI